jgi:hypothetical protein
VEERARFVGIARQCGFGLRKSNAEPVGRDHARLRNGLRVVRGEARVRERSQRRETRRFGDLGLEAELRDAFLVKARQGAVDMVGHRVGECIEEAPQVGPRRPRVDEARDGGPASPDLLRKPDSFVAQVERRDCREEAHFARGAGQGAVEIAGRRVARLRRGSEHLRSVPSCALA